MSSIDCLGTHIVGGNVSYQCLGANNYQVSLRVYRDCSGLSGFDLKASIAVYDTAGTLFAMLSPSVGKRVQIPDSFTGSRCMLAPVGSCIEYTDYIDTVFLPPINGGYTLVHQRCCLTSVITNVQSSGSYGISFSASIPSNDTTCNSSPVPVMNSLPIALCIGKPFEFSFECTDVNGDSLFYEFCDVLQGAGGGGGGGCFSLIPVPPCPPPYANIPYSPPYFASQPIYGTSGVNLDSLTGLLTITPNQIGSYLAAICVKEYRNDSLIGNSRFTYIYNVVPCKPSITSDFITPMEDSLMLCNGLSVHFVSQSVNANTLIWDFGDTTTIYDTSSLANPVYNYPAPGTYEVRLISFENSGCSDTASMIIDVHEKVIPNFSSTGTFCFEAQNVVFRPTGTYPQNAQFEWNFGAYANVPSYQGMTPPIISWNVSGSHIVSLSVRQGTCVETKFDTIVISELGVGVDAGPDQNITRGERVFLEAKGAQDYYWYSKVPVNFSDPWKRVTSSDIGVEVDTAWFYVVGWDYLGCKGVDSMIVVIEHSEYPINLITPNGDGKNEFFDLESLNVENDCELRVMNRWGSEVYHTFEYDNRWAGVDNGGNPLPDGTYYYILSRDNKLVWKGAISVIRM